jgi:signal peptidase I
MFKSPVAKGIIRWLAQIAPAIIITFFVVTYIAQFTLVKGDSMLPTFKKQHDTANRETDPEVWNVEKRGCSGNKNPGIP